MTARLYVVLAVLVALVVVAVLAWVAHRSRAALARAEAERVRAARHAAPWQMFSQPVPSCAEGPWGWVVGIERRLDTDDAPIEQQRMQFWASEPSELERVDVEGLAIAKAARYNATRGYTT